MGAGAPAERPNPFRRADGRFLQVMDLYLLIEGDDGLLVVDQHALHERVTYEQLKKQHAERDVQVQRLLVPAVLALELVAAALPMLRAAPLEGVTADASRIERLQGEAKGG